MLMKTKQAIVEGSPPDLPAEGFSEAARDFVAGCLNKIPKLRPTYAMLLQHAWLAPLQKPAMILEEDEEAASPVDPAAEKTADDKEKTSTPAAATAAAPSSMTQVVDEEVASWVLQALDRRRKTRAGVSGSGAGGGGDGKDESANGGNEGSAKPQTPALHAAPLDAVSPALERKEGL